MNVEKKRGLRKQMISNLNSSVKFLLAGLWVFTGLALINARNVFLGILFIMAALGITLSGYFGWRK
jgi:hypothetical protein